MIHGIGTDILNIERLLPVFENKTYLTDPFVNKTYTKKEIILAESRECPLHCYATRFAGKEAVFKALGAAGNELRLCDIEILSSDILKPYVVLHGQARAFADAHHITQIEISLSYDSDYAVAYAICCHQ